MCDSGSEGGVSPCPPGGRGASPFGPGAASIRQHTVKGFVYMHITQFIELRVYTLSILDPMGACSLAPRGAGGLALFGPGSNPKSEHSEIKQSEIRTQRNHTIVFGGRAALAPRGAGGLALFEPGSNPKSEHSEIKQSEIRTQRNLTIVSGGRGACPPGGREASPF